MFRKDKQKVAAKPDKKAVSLLPFKEIYENGVIRVDSSTYALLLRFKNAPYLSQTEKEHRSSSIT